MTQPETNKKISFWKYIFQPRPILDIFRALIYILFSLALFKIPNFLTDLPFYKYLFCISAFLYGCFRLYRVYYDYKIEIR